MIYLAAGNSRRFCIKEKQENKLLYQWKGKPLYQHGLKALREAAGSFGNCEIYVVTQYEEIASWVKSQEEIQAVWSPESKDGMSYSIKNGLRAAGTAADYYFFLTADQPMIKKETICDFLKETIASGKPFGSVRYEDTPGNPTMFHGKWYEKLLTLQGDQGGRRIMKQYPDEIFYYEVSEEAQLKDVDYYEDV